MRNFSFFQNWAISLFTACSTYGNVLSGLVDSDNAGNGDKPTTRTQHDRGNEMNRAALLAVLRQAARDAIERTAEDEVHYAAMLRDICGINNAPEMVGYLGGIGLIHPELATGLLKCTHN